MSETYKAIEVRKPGEFAEVSRPLARRVIHVITSMAKCVIARA